jgi:hypothetical protein
MPLAAPYWAYEQIGHDNLTRPRKVSCEPLGNRLDTAHILIANHDQGWCLNLPQALAGRRLQFLRLGLLILLTAAEGLQIHFAYARTHARIDGLRSLPSHHLEHRPR